jgi:hypothetical protein
MKRFLEATQAWQYVKRCGSGYYSVGDLIKSGEIAGYWSQDNKGYIVDTKITELIIKYKESKGYLTNDIKDNIKNYNDMRGNLKKELFGSSLALGATIFGILIGSALATKNALGYLLILGGIIYGVCSVHGFIKCIDGYHDLRKEEREILAELSEKGS